MSSNNNLPIILVSAVDSSAALSIISELTNDGSERPQTNGVDGRHDEPDPGDGIVWRLENKYYTASVRLLPRADAATAPLPAYIDAHLIYLTETECDDDSACARRAAAASDRLTRDAVRVVAARREAAAAAWARGARYELVPLEGEGEDRAPSPGPFPELVGLARVREALHAHPWPGLVLRGATQRPLDHGDSDSSASSEGEWGEWVGAEGAGGEGDEAGAVERAERFAAALAMIPAAREAAREGEGEGDHERRLRAEQLVAAFCRALGPDGDGEFR